MKVKILVFLIFLFPLYSYAYSIDDLLKELDTPLWKEKTSDPVFIEKFKSQELFSTVVKLAEAKGYDWRYRIRAIKLLGELGTPQAKEALLSMFQDPFFHHECPSLKSYVADALGNFKPEKRLLEILKDGLKDSEVLVREAVARSIGRLKMPEATEYLKEAFYSEKSIAVKIAILNALKSIGNLDALNFIKKVISEQQELNDVFGGSL
ncbi:MAG: HEAT repeat domain-containing protein [Thermodesulfovibrio sp.]|nr:HEAT repeat domain-containing protein [Thermodesulfovibrio sp.]